MGEWPLVAIDDLVEDIIDRRGVTPIKLGSNFTAAGHRVISAKLVKGGAIDLAADEPRYVDERTYARWMRSPLRADDVILTSEAPLGEVAYLGSDVDWVLGQRLFALRSDKHRLHGRWLYYALQTDPSRSDLHSRATGTTAQGIRQTELRHVRIPLPPITEQRRVSGILGALDDKIELNRRLAETLEGAAQALFKSWFLDSGSDAIDQDGSLADAVDLVRDQVDPQLEQGTVFQHYSLPAYDAGREAISEPGAGIRSSKFAVPDEQARRLLGLLAPDITKVIGASLPVARFTRLVTTSPGRETAPLLAAAPAARARTVLEEAAAGQPAGQGTAAKGDIDARRRHRAGSAGRLMTGSFVRLDPAMTIGKALAEVRATDPTVDIPDDLYVVDGPHQRLVGVVSIRALLMAKRGKHVGEVMATKPVSIAPEADAMDAANLLAQHQFLALPVVDQQGGVAGVIPVDDLMRDIVPRLNHFYASAVGADAEEIAKLSASQEASRRVPWLLGTMVLELASGLVIAHFNGVLQQVILLASFMPVISAISGNVGLQAAAITVRGLDTGAVSTARGLTALRKELATTLLMAVLCGLVLGTIGVLWSGRLPFGLVIGAALGCAMLTAATMGTVFPMVSKRVGFDPATTAGPFETAFQDVIGFGVFLWLASLLLPLLR
ncbi:MAG: magnesium transporter [Candidatus Limnocylindrales bacterium]